MNKTKNVFFAILGFALILGSLYTVLQRPAANSFQSAAAIQSTKQGSTSRFADTIDIIAGDVPIHAEVAQTNEELEQGLSGRTSLSPHTGMFFAFDNPGKYGFWMKDMNFPLDIIWLDENMMITGIERNVTPETYPKVFYPTRDIKFVLEVPAGTGTELALDTNVKLYFDSVK
ncbi:DUF192 domain-containing protein [Candidatus Parcubacteria bacterium]|nr:DUF192 domain-containing protein [Candidatus Parcubacteria bacterium]